jgi:hypothetical protein
MGIFTFLFLLHAALLALYEMRHVEQPAGAPERIAVGV